MKRQEKEVLHQESLVRLRERLAEEEKKLTETLIKLKQGQLKDVHAAKKIRKRIAVIKTIIREKELIKEAQNGQ